METQHHQLFAQHTTRALVSSNFNVITVKNSDTVARVLQVFKENNISSAPVVERTPIAGSEHTIHTYHGILDILDLVAFAVEIFSNIGSLSEELVHDLENQWKKTPVGHIIDVCGRSPIVPIHVDAPMLYCLGALSRPSVHRVPIIESTTSKDQALIGVVTQSHVISYLHENVSSFGERVRTTPVGQWMPPRAVIYVRSNTIVLDAFKKLCSCRVTGLAVLTDQDKLIGNLSASDLKKIDPDNLVAMMQLPVHRLLSLYPWSKAITVSVDDNLETVLDKLVKNKVHRIYIQQNEKALGVISLCDIIHYVSRPF